MRLDDDALNDLITAGDNRLLEALGADAYMEACALMRELEELVEALEPPKVSEALSTFSSLMALRYAERRRHMGERAAPPTATAEQAREAAQYLRPDEVKNALRAYRQTTGLTVDEIAGQFDVSRRAVTEWLRGGPMTAAHRERLRVLAQDAGTSDTGGDDG
jgi:DNA-binding transcriptional regulator YiaG